MWPKCSEWPKNNFPVDPTGGVTDPCGILLSWFYFQKCAKHLFRVSLTKGNVH